MTVAGALGFLLVFVLLIFFFQRKMMYHPRRYEPIEWRGLPPGATELPFSTSSGNQVAFYLPPRSDSAAIPNPLWVLFNGNAARALDWLDILEHADDAQAGYLLIDYPGYGRCEGKPTRAAIRESSEAAYAALAARLGADTAVLDPHLGILALSIGTGTGLDFAAAHPVRRVLLLAPFTTMLDMARRTVGTPLCHLLVDRYDNRARLRELAQRPIPPTVHIFHGDADEIIPFAMGQSLAREFPSMITFHPVAGADHNLLLMAAERDILRTMTEPPHEPAAKPTGHP